MRGDCELAAITRGADGSVVVTADEVVAVAGRPVERVLDTTGAGDLYAAGFLYGFTHGRSLAECGRLGSIAAAEVISHVGPRPLVELRTLCLNERLSRRADVAAPSTAWLAAEPDDDVPRRAAPALIAGAGATSWPSGSTAGCSSARPVCAASSAPDRCG